MSNDEKKTKVERGELNEFWVKDGRLGFSAFPWKRPCGVQNVVCSGIIVEGDVRKECAIREMCPAFDPDMKIQNILKNYTEEDILDHITTPFFHNYDLDKCSICKLRKECDVKNRPNKARKCTKISGNEDKEEVIKVLENYKYATFKQILDLISDFNNLRIKIKDAHDGVTLHLRENKEKYDKKICPICNEELKENGIKSKRSDKEFHEKCVENVGGISEIEKREFHSFFTGEFKRSAIRRNLDEQIKLFAYLAEAGVLKKIQEYLIKVGHDKYGDEFERRCIDRIFLEEFIKNNVYQEEFMEEFFDVMRKFENELEKS